VAHVPAGGASGSAAADEDAELQAAIAASLGEGGVGGVNGGVSVGGGGEDDQVQRAIAASLASGGAAAASVPPDPPAPELPRAPVPDEPGPNEGIALAFRVQESGARLQRRFNSTDTIGGVEAWLFASGGIDFSQRVLTTAFPRKRLTDRGATLGECGVGDKMALSVESGR
jgi:ataxin-3